MIDLETAKRLVDAIVTERDPEAGSAFGEDHCAELIDENGNVIHLFYEQGAGELVALGVIGKLPGDRDQAITVASWLLSQNLLWVNTQGATLALIREGSYVALQRRYEGAGESDFDFQAFLASFSDELAHWIETYESAGEQSEDGLSSLELNIV